MRRVLCVWESVGIARVKCFARLPIDETPTLRPPERFRLVSRRQARPVCSTERQIDTATLLHSRWHGAQIPDGAVDVEKVHRAGHRRP